MKEFGEPLTVNVQSFARLAGISNSTAYYCIKTGLVKAVRIGKRVLVPRAELERLFGTVAADNKANVNK